ncbi:hypothetical protein ECG_06028 [Echinococcus granulosus]|nr:hypothetical protein ECG_06028 [Echinococcus granulosus]
MYQIKLQRLGRAYLGASFSVNEVNYLSCNLAIVVLTNPSRDDRFSISHCFHGYRDVFRIGDCWRSCWMCGDEAEIVPRKAEPSVQCGVVTLFSVSVRRMCISSRLWRWRSTFW